MTANAIEIDRCLSTHLLSISDLEDLTRRTAALARGETSALSASSLPAPLALGAIAIDQARDPVERARALVRLAELAWKLLAFILMASLRGLQPGTFPGNEEPDPRSWPAPWRSLARAAARMLDGQPARVMELAAVALAPDRDGAFRAAMNVIAEAAALVASPAPDPAVLARGLPRLERAIRDTLAAFAPLRGWTLVAIVSAEVVDVDGTTQRIEYVDYTGSSARGSYQRVTVMGFRGLGRFAYLVRWNEGLAIALEPFVRRAHNDASRDQELFLATAAIREPRLHRYHSVNRVHEIELPVTAKQLGMSVGRRTTDDAAKR